MKRRKSYNKYTYDKITENIVSTETSEQAITDESKAERKKKVAKILTSTAMLSAMYGGGYSSKGDNKDE